MIWWIYDLFSFRIIGNTRKFHKCLRAHFVFCMPKLCRKILAERLLKSDLQLKCNAGGRVSIEWGIGFVSSFVELLQFADLSYTRDWWNLKNSRKLSVFERFDRNTVLLIQCHRTGLSTVLTLGRTDTTGDLSRIDPFSAVAGPLETDHQG